MPVNPNVWAGAQSNQTLAPITPGGGKFGSPGTPVVNKQWWEEGLPAGIGYLVDKGGDYLENKEIVEDPEAALISEFSQDFMANELQPDYINKQSALNNFYATQGKDAPNPKGNYSQNHGAWSKMKSTLEADLFAETQKVAKHKQRMLDYNKQSSIFESDTMFGDMLPNLLREELKPGQRWVDDIEGAAADSGAYNQSWLNTGNTGANYKSWLMSEINEQGVTDKRKANLLKYYNAYFGANK